MRNKFIFFCLLSIVFFSCRTTYKVYEVKQFKDKQIKNGLYYFLPNNILKVNLEIEKEEYFKGPYAEYAEKYLGLNNVELYNNTSYSIINIYVDIISEPDSAHCYLILPNQSNTSLQVSKSGIIESFNCTNRDHILKDDELNNYKQYSYNSNSTENPFYGKMVDLNVFEKIDTIVRKVKIDTNFIIEKSYKTSLIEKTIEQKAKEITDNISKIKEAKYNLISGEIEAIDKKNIEFMYSELQNNENEYIKLFTGLRIKTSYFYTYYCYPIKDTITNVYSYKLLSFSSTKGVLDKNSIEGEWVFLELHDKGYYSLIDKYQRKFNTKSNKNRGLYYRIPALVDVSVKQGNKKLFGTQKYLSQFGTISNLPIQNLSIIFDKETGLPRIIKSIYMK